MGQFRLIQSVCHPSLNTYVQELEGIAIAIAIDSCSASHARAKRGPTGRPEEGEGIWPVVHGRLLL